MLDLHTGHLDFYPTPQSMAARMFDPLYLTSFLTHVYACSSTALLPPCPPQHPACPSFLVRVPSPRSVDF